MSFLFPAICAPRRDVHRDVGPFNPALKQTEEADYGYRLSRRYRLVLTSLVSGRHDHDHTLRGPLHARARRFAKGFETATRAWGSLAASFPADAAPEVAA